MLLACNEPPEDVGKGLELALPSPDSDAADWGVADFGAIAVVGRFLDSITAEGDKIVPPLSRAAYGATIARVPEQYQRRLSEAVDSALRASPADAMAQLALVPDRLSKLLLAELASSLKLFDQQSIRFARAAAYAAGLWKLGDEAAFELLYEAVWAIAETVARRLLPGPRGANNLVDDVVQDAMIRLGRATSNDKYNFTKGVIGLVYILAQRSAKDEIRARARQDAVALPEDWFPVAEETGHVGDKYRKLFDAMFYLSELQRQCLMLRYYANLSSIMIANALPDDFPDTDKDSNKVEDKDRAARVDAVLAAARARLREILGGGFDK